VQQQQQYGLQHAGHLSCKVQAVALSCNERFQWQMWVCYALGVSNCDVTSV
jgi:hypothetical protein